MDILSTTCQVQGNEQADLLASRAPVVWTSMMDKEGLMKIVNVYLWKMQKQLKPELKNACLESCRFSKKEYDGAIPMDLQPVCN